MEKRFRSLDLLRAVAILLVILAHTVLSYGAPKYLAPLQFGGTGVDLFFVLSGWLLGSLLFREAERDGGIDVRRFWARRWMRTLPAYYVVLFFTIGQRYLTKENVEFPWEYLFFLQNYDFPLSFFTVSWSLCVEEQFYLVIAPLLAVLTCLTRRVTTVILLIMLFTPFLFRHMGWYWNSTLETHVSIDGCVAGVFLAHIHHQYQTVWNRIATYAPHLAVASVLCYLLFFVGRYYPSLGIRDPDKLVLAVLFASWVMAANVNSKWINGLYVPGAYYIATRSYALYLLHPDILALLRRFLGPVPFAVYFLLALTGSLLLAEILYRCIEKPVMDAREKFSFSSGNKRG